MIKDPSKPRQSIVDVPDVDTFRSDELTNIAAQPAVEVEQSVVEAEQPSVASSPPQPLERQVGGNHYRKLRIQPIEYILANELDFCQGNVVKLVTRYRDKGGIEDLDKAIHYIEFLKAKLRGEDAPTD